MTTITIDRQSAAEALDRLIAVARSDTGQSRRVANFLLAWWCGEEHGHFPIADMFGLDRAIAADISAIIGFIGQQPCAIYADEFGRREEIRDIIRLWRPARTEAA